MILLLRSDFVCGDDKMASVLKSALNSPQYLKALKKKEIAAALKHLNISRLLGGGSTVGRQSRNGR